MTDDFAYPPTTGNPRPGGPGVLGAHAVARIGYGAMQLEHLDRDRPAAIALLRRAVELGIDHIDTAQFYGNGLVNDLLREALHPEDEVVVVTKVGADPNPGGKVRLRLAQRPAELRSSVEDNLRSLGLEQISVVNLRRADVGPGLSAAGDQVVDVEDQLEAMIAMRDEGKIGAIGLSSVTLPVLRRALPAGIVCVQNAYSLVARAGEEMLDICRTEGIAWVPFFPLGGASPGALRVVDQPIVVEVAEAHGATAQQVGLAWLLQHAPHVLLIPGTADAAHLEANVDAGRIRFDSAELDALQGVDARTQEA